MNVKRQKTVKKEGFGFEGKKKANEKDNRGIPGPKRKKMQGGNQKRCESALKLKKEVNLLLKDLVERARGIGERANSLGDGVEGADGRVEALSHDEDSVPFHNNEKKNNKTMRGQMKIGKERGERSKSEAKRGK